MNVTKDEIDQSVRVLQVVKRRYRRLILDCLDVHGPQTMGMLVAMVNKPQSEVSQAVADLKMLRLVETEKESTTVTVTLHEKNWTLMQRIISALAKSQTKSWNYH